MATPATTLPPPVPPTVPVVGVTSAQDPLAAVNDLNKERLQLEEEIQKLSARIKNKKVLNKNRTKKLRKSRKEAEDKLDALMREIARKTGLMIIPGKFIQLSSKLTCNNL